MTTAKTFTCVAKCGTCGSVMNTAHGVPEEAKGQVTMSAPMVAFCEVSGHNSLSDVNWNLKLEWTEDTSIPHEAPPPVETAEASAGAVNAVRPEGDGLPSGLHKTQERRNDA